MSINRLTEKRVGAVLDNMGSRYKKYKILLFAATFGYMFDAFDQGIIGFLLPSMSEDLNISTVMIGLIISASMYGMVIGQYIMGPVSDHIGRKKPFIFTSIWYAVTTILTAFTQNGAMTWGLRFLTGAGTSSFCVNDSTMVTEMSPTKYRGCAVGVISSVFPLGKMLAGFTAIALLPLLGWRPLFLIGALPVIAAIIVRTHIPESPRWLVSRGRYEEAEKALREMGASDEDIENAKAIPDDNDMGQSPLTTKECLKELLSKKWRGTLFFGITVQICSNFGNASVIFWLPTILATQYGMTVTSSMLWTVIACASGFCGRILGALLIDKIGRKPLLLCSFSLAGVFCFAIAFVHDPWMLLGGIVCFYLFADPAAMTLMPYIPELFPTHLRGTGSNFCVATALILSALAPTIMGILMTKGLYVGIWFMLGGVYLIGVLVLAVFGRETKNRELKDLVDKKLAGQK